MKNIYNEYNKKKITNHKPVYLKTKTKTNLHSFVSLLKYVVVTYSTQQYPNCSHLSTQQYPSCSHLFHTTISYVTHLPNL